MTVRSFLSQALLWLPAMLAYYLGFGIHKLGVLLQALSLVIRRHVFYPIVVAKRMVAGAPSWQPRDLAIGVMPETKRQLALARADASLVEVPACTCDRPDCVNNNRKVFLPREALAGLELFKRSEMSIRNGRVELRPAAGEDPPPPAA